MKAILIFILCMVYSMFVMGQEPIATHRNVDEVKVKPPKFTGELIQAVDKEAKISIDEYMARHIVYPEEDSKNLIQGIEVVRFVVSPNGEVSDFEVINSISPNMDKEVIRVLETTNGMWIAGYNNDQPVSMESEVSVAFKLKYPERDFLALGQKYFDKGGQSLLEQGNAQKAIKHYNRAAHYVPNDVNLLLFRGMAFYEAGDTEGAFHDWERIKILGKSVSEVYLAKLKDRNGYDNLTSVLNREE